MDKKTLYGLGGSAFVSGIMMLAIGYGFLGNLLAISGLTVMLLAFIFNERGDE